MEHINHVGICVRFIILIFLSVRVGGTTYAVLQCIHPRLFSPHGQLYMVFSRACSFDNIAFAVTERHKQRID
jgi:hypothetical protein